MADSDTDNELLLAINASVVAVIALEKIQETNVGRCPTWWQPCRI